jgi:hypothetical protein
LNGHQISVAGHSRFRIAASRKPQGSATGARRSLLVSMPERLIAAIVPRATQTSSWEGEGRWSRP